MQEHLTTIIEEINENILVLKELKKSEFFEGIAHGLSNALALMNIINENQQDYINECIKNKKTVLIQDLEKFKDGE